MPRGIPRIPEPWEWVKTRACARCGQVKPWAKFAPARYWPDGTVRRERYADCDYVKFEPYPESESPKTGRFWTLDQLAAAEKGACGTTTTMGRALSETYARQPDFYGATYCVSCSKHLPVGEFVWTADGERVGS